MLCPKCKSPNVKVVDVLHRGDTEIYRRKKCLECQCSFRSAEIRDDGSVEFKRKYSEAFRAKYGKKRRKRNELP